MVASQKRTPIISIKKNIRCLQNGGKIVGVLFCTNSVFDNPKRNRERAFNYFNNYMNFMKKYKDTICLTGRIIQ